MSLAPQYRCHKIVTALPIIDSISHPSFSRLWVQYDDRIVFYTAAEKLTARYTPTRGDMLVFYTDESFEFVEQDGIITLPEHLSRTYVSISPKAEFDAGYAALADAYSQNAPVDHETVRLKLEEALIGKTELNQAEQRHAVRAALDELRANGVIRQSGMIAYHVPTESWTVLVGASVYVVNAKGCI